MKQPDISAVVPNYNGRHLLQKNLPLLMQSLKTIGSQFEVIVPDDCSTDDSVGFLKANFPEVLVVEAQKNGGFATNVNRGIMAAKHSLVFIMNNDVSLFPDYFVPCLRYFEREDTFGVMGRIINMDDDQIQDGAKYPVYNGLSLKTTRNYLPVEFRKGMWLPSLFLSGANALVRREMLQELGGFEELYSPFYMEDVDLSVRAWRLGWKSYYEHMAICRHPASTTIKSHHTDRWIKTVSARNRLLFHNLHLDGFKKSLWFFALIFKLVFKGLLMETYYLKGFAMYMEQIKKLRAARWRFRELTNKYKVKKSLREVVGEIKEDIGGIEIKKF